MATITIKQYHNDNVPASALKGIGKIEKVETYDEFGENWIILTIPRMSSTRFNNVVKRVLEKNLTEQGITPISIKYSE